MASPPTIAPKPMPAFAPETFKVPAKAFGCDAAFITRIGQMGYSAVVATPIPFAQAVVLATSTLPGSFSKWPFGHTTNGRADLDPVPNFLSGRLADILDLLPWMGLRLDRRA